MQDESGHINNDTVQLTLPAECLRFFLYFDQKYCYSQQQSCISQS